MPYDERLVGDPKSGVIYGGAVSALMDTCGGAKADLVEMTAIIGLSRATISQDIEAGRLDPRALDQSHPPRQPKTIDFTLDCLRTGLPRDACARSRVNRSGRRHASVRVEAWQDIRGRYFAQATCHHPMPARKVAASDG